MCDKIVVRNHAVPDAPPATLDSDIRCNTEPLRKFAFALPSMVVRDAVVAVAAVEFADVVFPRKQTFWQRKLSLEIPVSEPDRWNAQPVTTELSKVLHCLTGDHWDFKFIPRTRKEQVPSTLYLPYERPVAAVMAYSDGLDSLALAEIEQHKLKEQLLLIRVQRGQQQPNQNFLPFGSVPYSLRFNGRRKESSGRSRAFKYVMFAAMGAHMAGASRILLPESGQSALGPSLIYSEPENLHRGAHPLFAKRMESFLHVLFEQSIRVEIPRLWSTKGDTLRTLLRQCPDVPWNKTKFCWKDSRHSSANGVLHPCGVCSACMLRQLSVHTAELREPSGTYGCDLNSDTLEGGLIPGYKYTSSLRGDAVTGIRSLAYLAEMAQPNKIDRLRPYALQLSTPLSRSPTSILSSLIELVKRHAYQWQAFLESLHRNSFVRKWADLRL